MGHPSVAYSDFFSSKATSQMAVSVCLSDGFNGKFFESISNFLSLALFSLPPSFSLSYNVIFESCFFGLTSIPKSFATLGYNCGSSNLDSHCK